MEEKSTGEVLRELGKANFFLSNDAEKRDRGIAFLLMAQRQGDPEAM